MSDDSKPQIRLIAFSEQPAEGTSGPAFLQVYIVNEWSEALEILDDLDSINIAPRAMHDGESVFDTDLIHVDYGISGLGKFVRVDPGEAMKVTLVLADEHAALLARSRLLKAAVRFRRCVDETGQMQTVLLPATVHTTRHP